MNPKICPTCHAPIPPHAPGGFCPACLLRDADEPPASGHAAPSLDEISAAFPQLEVIGLIGQGGMGFVYQVRQPGLDRTVALKILSPELGRDPAFAERFARESRALGKLNHPNIVTVFEHGESGGFFYLLMEYVDGVNLRQAMRAGRFTPEQALAIVPGICDALQAAHAQGIWHRDIKPENILLDREGRVKIADFGIARIIGDPHRDFTLTRTGGALGSAAYMAPEQHEKPHDVDHRADIYSLGVVIYEMLTGELPLGRFPAPSQRAAVDARIDEIVFKTLEKERELRQQSAAEVRTDVEEARKSSASGVRPLLWRTRDAAGNFLFLLSAGLIASGVFLHHTGHSLGVSSHDIAAIVLSILGRVGVSLGFVTAAYATYSRKPRPWVAGVGVFVSLAIIFLLGSGFFPLLMSLGFLVAAGLLGTVGFLDTKRPETKHKFHPPSAPGVKTEMQDAVPESTSSLRRLPRLVRWSLGLFLGGGALMGSAALVADSFKTQQTTAMMALLIALGGVALAAGFLGALRALYEIKRGWAPPTSRWLLIAVAVPTLTAAWCGLSGFAISTLERKSLAGPYLVSFLPDKGSVLIQQAFVLGYLSLAFASVFHLVRPLSPATKTRREMGMVCLVLAACATIGSAVLAKRLDCHWPQVFYRDVATLALVNPGRVSNDQVLAMLKRAAGPFADDYLLDVREYRTEVTQVNPQEAVEMSPHTAVSVAGMTRKPAFLTLEGRKITHAQACLYRLRDLLPADTIHLSAVASEGVMRGIPPTMALPLLAGLAALLAALAGGRRAVGIITGGVALHLALVVLPVWRTPEDLKPPRLLDAPPLSLTVAPDLLPQPDFSTPEKAVMSVYDAACFGRIDAVKRGLSKDAIAFLNEKNGWDGFMDVYSGLRVVAVLKSLAADNNSARVNGTVINRSGGNAGSGYEMNVVRENGEWRVASLHGLKPGDGRFGQTNAQTTTIALPEKTRWQVRNMDIKGQPAESFELQGKLEANSTTGGGYTAATVHVGGQPLFMIVGKGYMGGYFNWQSIGNDRHGNLGDISFALSDENQAIIENRTYDLTRGRVFFAQSDGTLRQIATRLERVLSGDGLKNFVAALPPENPGAAAPSTIEARLEAMEAQMNSIKPTPPQYRAVCRIEVHLKRGDTVALLNEALGKFCTVLPVPGVNDQFDLVVTDPDPAQTSRLANSIAQHAEELLKEREIQGTVKILKPAERPEKPIHADEGPASPQSPMK